VVLPEHITDEMSKAVLEQPYGSPYAKARHGISGLERRAVRRGSARDIRVVRAAIVYRRPP
jgi:hypothetical protein